MKMVIGTERLPIKMWLDDIEPGAVEQAKNLANLPFAYKWIALMPDCHQGYGMPIGGVLASDDVIVPNAVGVDIGCGMAAVKTSLTGIDAETLKLIMQIIRKDIPVGPNHQKENQPWTGFDEAPDVDIIQQELNNARKQLGTLGGGNHFWEMQKGSDGYVWIMIHSGSRNFGLKIANDFHNKAKSACGRFYSSIPTEDLSFLPSMLYEWDEYFAAMNFALAFAKQNRHDMMEASRRAVRLVIPGTAFNEIIDVHHNYARTEHHFGKDVIVHRKGATSARAGEIGIIPGSQGTKSYIVRGKGNPESFMSCSHGAGRKMGRKEAERTLDLAAEQKRLDDQGIIHSVRTKGDLDEAAGAYKDIDTVMENQADLVEILVELTPLAVIKG